jgi:hypothetical protein
MVARNSSTATSGQDSWADLNFRQVLQTDFQDLENGKKPVAHSSRANKKSMLSV